MKIQTQEISFALLKKYQVRLFIKRLDLIHPFISGNKWYKLKYNIIEAKKQNFQTILTFGGAYSNHIASTAYVAQEKGFNSIGIIRGEKKENLNSTLSLAEANGMTLYYLERSDYRKKNTCDFISQLKKRFGKFYLIPEGGTNKLAIKGASEILDNNDSQEFICCSVGTGGTMAGIINSSSSNQKLIGFPAIKGAEQLDMFLNQHTNKRNWRLINDYVCGGYAKFSHELIDLILDFYNKYQIPLDLIYTSKMMLGILDLLKKGYFPKGSDILAIHTGGLQGNRGMNQRFGLDIPQ